MATKQELHSIEIMDRWNAANDIPLIDTSDFSATEKLDVVLKELNKHKGGALELEEVSLRLRENGYRFDGEIYLILRKLHKDEMAFCDEYEINHKIVRFYGITFEGAFRLEVDKGYSGLYLKENEDRALGKANETNTRYGVIGAAVFGGGLMLLEILKFFQATKENALFVMFPFVVAFLFFVLRYFLQRLDS